MLNVIKPGVLSCIQDIGRHGYRHLGVSQSGVMDPIAMKLANLLVDNDTDDPVLEVTIGLAEFLFSKPVNFAITGGDLSAKLNNKRIYPGWRYYANSGDTLTFSTSRSAQRAYLSVQGGFVIKQVLGAKATDIQANFGGFQGRTLQPNDILPYSPSHKAMSTMGVKQPHYTDQVRVLKGPHCDMLPKSAFEKLLNTSWKISELNNRMGARLISSKPISHGITIASQAVHPGIIQLPPSGEPIILLNDCQTTGGYPIIAIVIRADLRLFSQLGSKQHCRFVPCDLSQAQLANTKLESHLAQFMLAKNNNIE